MLTICRLEIHKTLISKSSAKRIFIEVRFLNFSIPIKDKSWVGLRFWWKHMVDIPYGLRLIAPWHLRSQEIDCLFIKLATNIISKFHWSYVRGIHRSLADSFHKVPVMLNVLRWHSVFMKVCWFVTIWPRAFLVMHDAQIRRQALIGLPLSATWSQASKSLWPDHFVQRPLTDKERDCTKVNFITIT